MLGPHDIIRRRRRRARLEPIRTPRVEGAAGRQRAETRHAAVDRAEALARRAAASGDNLVPPIIAAVEAAATVGEIADAMRSVFGEYEETTTL